VSLWSRSEKVPVSTVSTVSITTIRLDNYDITDDQEGMYPFVSESPLLTVYGLSLGRQNNAHVTDVHDITGLIHGPAAGADASCIYLESFSFSLLCTIEYTHTVSPNFHIVTAHVTLNGSVTS